MWDGWPNFELVLIKDASDSYLYGHCNIKIIIDRDEPKSANKPKFRPSYSDSVEVPLISTSIIMTISRAMFFDGHLQDGIALALEQRKVVVCFVTGS